LQEAFLCLHLDNALALNENGHHEPAEGRMMRASDCGSCGRKLDPFSRRKTGVASNSVSSLLVEPGSACSEYRDRAMRNLSGKTVQVDEI